MTNIAFLTVVYSTPPHLTHTIKSVCELNFKKFDIVPHLIIWDNSIDGYDCSQLFNFFDNKSITYCHKGKNEKLSKVYNQIIKDFSEINDFLVILDDDSMLSDEYLRELINFISLSKDSDSLAIAIPQIFYKNNLISPGIVKGVRGYRLSSICSGISKRSDIVAMMSGTVIKLNHPQMPQFDERLNFYGVDTKFFMNAIREKILIYIMNYKMYHESALRDESLKYEEHILRLSNLFLARKIIYEDVCCGKLRLLIYKFFFSIKLVLLKKNLGYLKLIIV
ncbi:glycosyltransferase [Klebsiella spallanzanii]